MYRSFLKFFIDWIVAVCVLVLLSPLFVVIGFAIFVESGSPVFFRQTRVGINGRLFTIYKFRTMYLNTKHVIRNDGTFITEAADPRVTRVGRLIRFGLDELPQLLNILLGDMSLIGPRPDLPIHYESFNDEQRTKYLVRPGISNLPAICGRNDLPLAQRVMLDIYYVRRLSFFLDIKILIGTLLLPFGVKTNPDKYISRIQNGEVHNL